MQVEVALNHDCDERYSGRVLGLRAQSAVDITHLNSGQGLTANLMTAFLVLGASRMGVPISTTHVSCGAIFGIGLINGKRQWSTIVRILTTWITTLPLGLALGWALYSLLH